jgi:hypothetical protein
MFPMRNPAEGNDGILHLDDGIYCSPGDDCFATIEPLREDLTSAWVQVGAEFQMREGPRIIGLGTVREVISD